MTYHITALLAVVVLTIIIMTTTTAATAKKRRKHDEEDGMDEFDSFYYQPRQEASDLFFDKNTHKKKQTFSGRQVKDPPAPRQTKRFASYQPIVVSEGSIDEEASLDDVIEISLRSSDERQQQQRNKDDTTSSSSCYSHMTLTCRLFLLALATWILVFTKLRAVRNIRENFQMPLLPRNHDKNNPEQNDQSPSYLCGCSLCEHLWMCAERVEWLLQEYSFSSATSATTTVASSNQQQVVLTEDQACQQVATEYPFRCRVCSTSPTQCNSDPQLDLDAWHDEEPPLYCFPPAADRVRYTLWNGKRLDVKQSAGTTAVCGPRQNHFSATGVRVVEADNHLVLRYQAASASEVRIRLPANEHPYHYGTYTFSVHSITVRNKQGNVISNNNNKELPDGIILSFSTYDPNTLHPNGEASHHQVSMNLGQWSSNNGDNDNNVVFSVEPALPHTTHRFAKPRLAGNSTYSFTWSPGSISWEASSSGRGGNADDEKDDDNNKQTFQVTTEYAVTHDLPDVIPCLPDYHMDVRISLYSALGRDLGFDGSVEVVVDGFDFIPSTDNEAFLATGQACSQSCQCQASDECVLQSCQEI